MDCFHCDTERTDWALDKLGELLDAGVPPDWIIGKMTEVIAIAFQVDLNADTESSVELEDQTPVASGDPA